LQDGNPSRDLGDIDGATRSPDSHHCDDDADFLTTTSGDKLVGEIKSVEKDVLTLSTDYSDSDFKIKWEKIASIESSRQFLVETFAGDRLAGTLARDPATAATVEVANSSVKLPDVSSVEPFERTFWARFDAGFDFGYSLTEDPSNPEALSPSV